MARPPPRRRDLRRYSRHLQHRPICRDYPVELTYTSLDNTTIQAVLDDGEQLGNVSGPATVFVPVELNVSPRHSVNNTMHCAFSNTILLCQRVMRHTALTACQNGADLSDC